MTSLVVALAPQTAAACSCFGAPWLQWPEAELPADHAMAMGSCFEDTFLEMMRATVDGQPVELVVDDATTGESYLGLRLSPPPAPGQQVVLEACNDDCGEPGDWMVHATLDVVDPLSPAAPAPILEGALSHASGMFEEGCAQTGFKTGLTFDVTPTANVMYTVAFGLDGEAPLFSKYVRVLDPEMGDTTQYSVTQYLPQESDLGVDPELLCAVVTVHDFAGGSSPPVQICGSSEEPAETSGTTDSGSDSDSTTAGSDGSSATGDSDDSSAATESTEPTGDEGSDDGCGCRSTHGQEGYLWALLLVVASARRRSRR